MRGAMAEVTLGYLTYVAALVYSLGVMDKKLCKDAADGPCRRLILILDAYHAAPGCTMRAASVTSSVP